MGVRKIEGRAKKVGFFNLLVDSLELGNEETYVYLHSKPSDYIEALTL